MTAGILGFRIGAAGTAGILLLVGGVPPSDAFVWFAWLNVVGIGGAVGAGVGLATRNVRRSPAIRSRVSIVLVALSILVLWRHERERRAVPEMLASTDSMRGVVNGTNVFGSLLLTYSHDGRHGRMVARRKHAHARLEEGDSMTVYLERGPRFEVVDVWPAGPDTRATLRHLFWLWLIGGALLAGYGAEIIPWFRNPPRPPR